MWGEISVDEKRGIVYAPTASAKYNFYGADRKGANLFGDCLLALDARTGKRLWHFQMVHHDIWDYDDATAPKLLTVRHEGKTVDVVAQVSKQGFVWVFDRVTGEPLWPIEERPRSASPTCREKRRGRRSRFPIEAAAVRAAEVHRRRFESVSDARRSRAFSRRDPERAQRRPVHAAGERTTIQMPGNNGGANWGGAAVDPTKRHAVRGLEGSPRDAQAGEGSGSR